MKFFIFILVVATIASGSNNQRMMNEPYYDDREEYMDMMDDEDIYLMTAQDYGLSMKDVQYFGGMSIMPLPNGQCTCPPPLKSNRFSKDYQQHSMGSRPKVNKHHKQHYFNDPYEIKYDQVDTVRTGKPRAEDTQI